jgi:hypothetical protein
MRQQILQFRRDYANHLRAGNIVFREWLEGPTPAHVVVNAAYRNLQRKMLGYMCFVMKHHTIAMSNFQSDPSVTTRVSRGSDAWRALVILFYERGVGKTIGLLALLDSQGDSDIIDAFL